MVSDGFWWVPRVFDGFWWILMGFDGFWWILMGSDGFRCVMIDPRDICSVTLHSGFCTRIMLSPEKSSISCRKLEQFPTLNTSLKLFFRGVIRYVGCFFPGSSSTRCAQAARDTRPRRSHLLYDANKGSLHSDCRRVHYVRQYGNRHAGAVAPDLDAGNDEHADVAVRHGVPAGQHRLPARHESIRPTRPPNGPMAGRHGGNDHRGDMFTRGTLQKRSIHGVKHATTSHHHLHPKYQLQGFLIGSRHSMRLLRFRFHRPRPLVTWSSRMPAWASPSAWWTHPWCPSWATWWTFGTPPCTAVSTPSPTWPFVSALPSVKVQLLNVPSNNNNELGTKIVRKIV